MISKEIKQFIKEEILKEIRRFRTLHHSEITPKFIKQRHIEDVVIKFGLAADRPSDGGAVNTKSYFATDTDTFSCWNGNAWVEQVLS